MNQIENFAQFDAPRVLAACREYDTDINYQFVVNGRVVLTRNSRELLRWSYMHKDINHRAAFRAELESHAVGDKVWCQEGGYCYVDHVRSESNPFLLTKEEAWQRYLYMLRNQDGEYTQWIRTMPAEKASYTKGQTRDLIMEAFEDGHPHTVSNVRYECN